MENSTRQMWPFLIEDGEKHWVSAEGTDDAIAIVADQTGYKSVDEYVDDIGGRPKIRQLRLDEIIEINVDPIDHKVKHIPKNGSVVIKATAKAWADMGRGLIGSTCW